MNSRLNFWFNSDPRLAIPCVALPHVDVQISMQSSMVDIVRLKVLNIYSDKTRVEYIRDAFFKLNDKYWIDAQDYLDKHFKDITYCMFKSSGKLNMELWFDPNRHMEIEYMLRNIPNDLINIILKY